MTVTRLRFVGDMIAYEFAILVDGTPTPLPAATLEAAAIDPAGGTVPASAAWLASPDDHVVLVTIAAGATVLVGRHDLQLRVSDDSLAEPVRARVFLDLLASAV